MRALGALWCLGSEVLASYGLRLASLGLGLIRVPRSRHGSKGRY